MQKEKNSYVGYIYKIINSVNDKIYIGQTRADLGIRWSQHKYSMKYEKHKPLYRAMSKYGFEKFRIIPLETVNASTLDKIVEILNEREMYYISLYNTLSPYGYNLTVGGNQTSIYATKAVDAYNASGELMYSFDSTTEAVKVLGIAGKQHHGISSCCRGKSDSALGYIWRYRGEPFDKYPIKTTQQQLDRYNNLIPVDQYSLSGNFLASYSQITDALLSIGKLSGGTSITRCCKGQTNKAYGYVWRYKNDPFDLYREHHYGQTPVDIYEKSGVLVGKFSSINNAIRALGLKPSLHASAVYCCKGYYLTCGGYVWRYTSEPFDKYPLKRKLREYKPICRYTLDDKFVDMKESANQYAKTLKLSGGSHVLGACKGKTKGHFAYGYKWYFADDPVRP